MTSYLTGHTREALLEAQERTRLINDLLGRCLAALEQGLAADIMGVPCHALIEQYASLMSSQAKVLSLKLSALTCTLGSLHDRASAAD